MPFLSRDQILAVQDRQYRDVDVPEWGGKVRIGALDALQQERYQTSYSKITQANGSSNISTRALLVSLSVVDEQGNPLFNTGDVETLSRRDSKVIERLVSEIVKVNGLDGKAVEEQKSF